MGECVRAREQAVAIAERTKQGRWGLTGLEEDNDSSPSSAAAGAGAGAAHHRKTSSKTGGVGGGGKGDAKQAQPGAAAAAAAQARAVASGTAIELGKYRLPRELLEQHERLRASYQSLLEGFFEALRTPGGQGAGGAAQAALMGALSGSGASSSSEMTQQQAMAQQRKNTRLQHNLGFLSFRLDFNEYYSTLVRSR
jgi:hypothetical protein